MQINNKNRAESLAAVIIAVFILSIALMGIINVVSFSKETAIGYEKEIFKHILKSNSDNLIKKIDSSNLGKNESFYIYKDSNNKEFKVLTGALNEEYKYIDLLGNKIENTPENIGKLYKREFLHQSDILKHRIDPPEIPNLVFHFDANNPNGDDITPTNGVTINSWKDLSGNGYDAVAVTGKSRTKKSGLTQATFDLTGLNGRPAIYFNGTSDIYQLPMNIDINNDDNGSYDKSYPEKSIAIALKTSDDVTSQQVIYEQGGNATGYNFMIRNGDIYAGVHNLSNSFPIWDSTDEFKSVNLGEALPNTVYYIMVVQDSSNVDKDGDYIDSLNKLQIFLNGKLVMEADHVDPQGEHHIGAIGGVNEWNVRPWDESVITSGDGQSGCDNQCLFFKGGIGEFISWNHALSKSEVRGVQNYFLERWLGGKESVEYSIINTDINKYISN